ncbi:LOW QUALITY PROTEIN: hypothetical protein OSB04_001852 [Centaurea solstitialis]|uniref:MULE transposase domain-containing protein n=1 Tax=Centaurea solstitialis TaxID=347529 RepID=A0AA38U2C1_9ASTR|nr:LOW QUALITY PROTEIN: hypothetical protein OSB04_001852 [Centaurea solstitialis]
MSQKSLFLPLVLCFSLLVIVLKCIESMQIMQVFTQTTFNDKSVRIKYLVCHKHGVPNKRSVDSINVSEKQKVLRNTNFKVTGSEAQVRFCRVDGTSLYKLYYFHPNHNHPLYDENDKMLSRNRRQLKFSDKRLIYRAGNVNIGESKAHQIQVCLKGGYEEVGSSRMDYKNFKRDFDSFVGDGDVQMVINLFNERVVNGTNFAFEYKVSNGKLEGLFWADELSRFNYKEFGHVISFDATYRSNKHCMVFVPFLAIDNNRHSVVVGSGILCDEKCPSYTWLLEAFLKVHGVQPKVVLTNQDVAIKEAFPVVFNESRHRLCMWHIMDKLPSRVGSNIIVQTDFRQRLLKLSVYLGPQEFEAKWTELLGEYNLLGHPWLSYVYKLRSEWIPAYFKELPMCGLMKTTSRSESLNSFFRSFEHHGNCLLKFILSHDTAMDKQRNRSVERHAALVYTRTVFFDVQKEIVKADQYCSQCNVVVDGTRQIFTIRQKDKSFKTKAEFKFVIDHICLMCGLFYCKMMDHWHVIVKFLNVEKIPSQYIHRRWTRGVIPKDVLRTRRIQRGSNERSDQLTNDIQFEFDQIMSKSYGDEEKLELFLKKVRLIKSEFPTDVISEKGSTKDAYFEKFFGVSKPTNIDVRAPEGIRNKGCGTGKRLQSGGERAMKSARYQRKCKACNEFTNHDSRNCPKKKRLAI